MECIYCKIKIASVSHFRAHIITTKHITNLAQYNETNKPSTTNTSTTEININDNTQATVNNTQQSNNADTNEKIKYSCMHCNKKLYNKYTLKRHYESCKMVTKIVNNTIPLINDTLYIDNIRFIISQQNTNNTMQSCKSQPSNSNIGELVTNNSIETATIRPNIVEKPAKGIIYLIQPTELLGTDRYKIGCSLKTDLSRCLSYKKNSRYICIQECYHPIQLETKIKQYFTNTFSLFAGKEYFAGVEKTIRQSFLNIVESHNSLYDDN